MLCPASGTIVPAGAAPLAKDPRLSDIPLGRLFPTPDTGRAYGEQMWSLNLFCTGKKGSNHPLCWKRALAWATKTPAVQHRACSGRHLGLESPASGRKGEKQPETPSGSFDNLFPKLTHLRGKGQWGLGGPWLGAWPRKPDSGMSTYVCGWVTSWSEPRKEKHGERPKRNEPLTGGLPFNQTVLNR